MIDKNENEDTRLFALCDVKKDLTFNSVHLSSDAINCKDPLLREYIHDIKCIFAADLYNEAQTTVENFLTFFKEYSLKRDKKGKFATAGPVKRDKNIRVTAREKTKIEELRTAVYHCYKCGKLQNWLGDEAPDRESENFIPSYIPNICLDCWQPALRAVLFKNHEYPREKRTAR
jgi:hypothetical protein